MNKSVTSFYKKENDPEYYKKYEREHSPRFDFLEKHFKFDKLSFRAIADFGCGAGAFLNRFSNTNIKYGFDGADLKHVSPLSFDFYHADFEVPFVNELRESNKFLINHPYTNISFCFETLEHIGNPYNLLVEIKKMTMNGGDIYVSIPDERMTHNVVYPGLMFPHTNFEQFLEQMALPIQEAVLFDGDWPSRIWHCKNAPWREKKLKYSKSEEKFLNISPLECTNI